MTMNENSLAEVLYEDIENLHSAKKEYEEELQRLSETPRIQQEFKVGERVKRLILLRDGNNLGYKYGQITMRYSKSEIILKNGKIVPIHLDASTIAPTLSLTLVEQKIELVPGQKNTLTHDLSSLASVKDAHKVAFDKYRSLKSK